MTQEDYNKKFDVTDPASKKLEAAFVQVSDIRKFEIGLYWTRATYFWTLIAVAFGGYFAIYSADKFDNQYLLTMIVGSVGLVFTFAWYLANRGSKYWQENWENHLDLLEDHITGPLYKTLLERPGFDSNSEKYVTGPLSVSVSKINQWAGVYVIFIWIVLVLLAGGKSLSELSTGLEQWLMIGVHLVVVFGAVGCCCLMVRRGKTHKKKMNPKMVERETEINGCA